MQTKLPEWLGELRDLLSPRVKLRENSGGVLLRLQGRTWRARPGASDDLALRTFAPRLFPACAGVVPSSDGFFLIEEAPRGVRLDHHPGERQYQRLAMLNWTLHSAGYTPGDVELQRLFSTDSGLKMLALPGTGVEERAAMALAWARAFVTGRKATAGMRADKLAPLIQRVLGGESALPGMLRATIAQLPDADTWRNRIRGCLDAAMSGDIPRILVASDTDQGAAIHALVCEGAAEKELCAGDGVLFSSRQDVRLIGPTTASDCERRLGRLSPGPTVAIVVGSYLDVSRELEHVGQVVGAPEVSGRGMFEWLRPLGAEASRVVEELVPALEQDPATARRTVAALIERAGARMDGAEITIASDWVEHWQGARSRDVGLSVMRQDAARVAQLIALSPGGLHAENLADTKELAHGASMLEDLGVAVRKGDALVAPEGSRAPVTDVASRRAMLLWLSERDHLAPDQRQPLREAWRMGLGLRAGDLSCWEDDGGEELFHGLIAEQAYTEALLLAEAHAAGAVRTDSGPPSLDVLYSACDLAFALWKPRRLRRMLRMWLRGYSGEWRAVALGLLGRVERNLGGSDVYVPLIDELERLCADLPRFPREQALIEGAFCSCPDDPARARELLKGVSKHPAKAAKYLCAARMHMIHAECGLVAIQIEESFSHVQQARDVLSPRGLFTRRARLEAEIEQRHMTCHSMLSFYKVDADLLLQPIRDTQERTGVVGDILRAAIVGDWLMRMRTWEVGLMTLEQMNGVLAEARPDNLRGYLIALYQLEECALYRGECGAARQLSARIGALSKGADRNQTIYSAWRRHEGLRRALAGDLPRALSVWRESRSWHIPEPWRSRTHMLRRGEWGFVLMVAGKFKRAAFWLQQTFERLANMSAAGRGSSYLMCRMLCDLIRGRELSGEDHEYIEAFTDRGYIFSRVCKYIADAAKGTLDWQIVGERIEEVPAPEFWRALGLCSAAVVAKRLRRPEAVVLARSARTLLTQEWVVFRRWLDAEFPEPEESSRELGADVLQALHEMRMPREPSPFEFSKLACTAAARATAASGAMAQAALDNPAMTGEFDGQLRDVLERALLGETVQDNGCVAISLQSPFGALAVRTSSTTALESLNAVAERLGELHELAESRNDLQSRRRKGREVVRAAWSLASGDPTLAVRLAALRSLVLAETGASEAGLALVRGTDVLLTTGNPAHWTGEATQPVDPTFRLRARISGGDTVSLDESTLKAARALAEILSASPERLRLELGRPADDEDLTIGGEPAGRSAAVRRLHDDLRRFADLDLAVTITGEPGSGKDQAARALHGLSARSSQAHVVVDCPTLRRETAASELFGHVRGAFTGATHDHIGMLERAGEGTLQVEGIVDLDSSIQAMLLRAFQARTFLPVGGQREREFKARIVVTSTESLQDLVAAGKLREDLAQRLQGVTLKIPPLRERGEDSLLIARHVLSVQAQQLNRRLRLTKPGERYILDHNWPGNVRELRAAVTRAAVMTDDDEIGLAELQTPDLGNAPGTLLLPADTPGLNTTTRVILGTLRQLGETQPGALARRLGLSRTTVSTGLSHLARSGFCERLGRGRATRYRAL